MEHKSGLLKRSVLLIALLVLGLCVLSDYCLAGLNLTVYTYIPPGGSEPTKLQGYWTLYWSSYPGATEYKIIEYTDSYPDGHVLVQGISPETTSWISSYFDTPIWFNGEVDEWDFIYGAVKGITYFVEAVLADNTSVAIEGPVTSNDALLISPDVNAMTKDPINITNGNMFYKSEDVSIAGLGPALEFTRMYHSRSDYNDPLGYGWTHTFNQSLEADRVNNRIYRDGSGQEYTFYYDSNQDTYIVDWSLRGITLVMNGDNTWTITKKDGTQYNFSSEGLLTSIVDRNNNTLTLTYTGDLLTAVTDATGRAITLTYDANNRIIQLTDPANNTIDYAYDTNGNLIECADRLDYTTTYTYDTNHNITCITDAENRSTYFSYDDQDRAFANWNDNDYNKVILSYDAQNNTTEVSAVDNDVLTAVKVSDVSNGVLTEFNSDGTFKYTPNPGYVGIDSFTYKLTNGVTESGPITVTITVTAN